MRSERLPLILISLQQLYLPQSLCPLNDFYLSTKARLPQPGRWAFSVEGPIVFVQVLSRDQQRFDLNRYGKTRHR